VQWWTASPAIVAEALVAVPDPLLTALRPGPPASAEAVAASLAQSLSPAEVSDPAPSWLLPEQERSFRRALAAVRRHGGAILADPVGSGKTYIALAVAAAVNQRNATACLVPATLLPHWESVALRLGVPVKLGSHEQVSRGKLPDTASGLVVVDESHHFRNRLTKRYAHLARWLVGRPALFVTATPVVNRLSDLGHQLWLAVRDDALALDGIVSLRSLLANGCSAAGLGRLVVEREVVAESRPRKLPRISVPTIEESRAATRSGEMLNRLRLSRNGSIASLIRGVLLRASGSSPAALTGCLKRYRRLLLHAQDASRAGHPMSRSELRRFAGELHDQLVWWELLPSSCGSSDLELADLGELDGQIQAASAATEQADAKLARLQELLSDATSTLIFTGSRDTVRYIRDRLCDCRMAWCTGDRAGIGTTTLPRAIVLGWFREGAAGSLAPLHLVVTDVAAEGLDLQRAARVVHYDLPWTPMRLEQREGRAVRLGSRHREVEVVRFALPPELERLIRVEAALALKAKLPGSAGLGSDGRDIWRWRAELAERLGGIEPVAGVAAVASTPGGMLAGFELHRLDDPAVCLGAFVGWLETDGVWQETPEIVAERLLTAAHGKPSRVDGQRLRGCLEGLALPIRDRLALTRGRHWIAAEPAPSARQVAARLHGLIGAAARMREARRLLRLEGALAFVAGGHTAGEAMMIERLAGSADCALEARLGRLARAQSQGDEIEVRLTGLIVFGPDDSANPP
jgi:superfamily II DNA or RNA helicase